MRPQVGQVINNKYRLVRLIGDGGMGSVYESKHEVLGTTVALKFLHPELSRRQGLVQRFLQEARVSAQIQSPHVVRVSDVDQSTTGLAFIVMEYLEGRTLQTLYEDLYRAGQRLSYDDALDYALQMLEGVEAAHRTGVVHRDLKPDNVMITEDARKKPLIKLLDFGIAKLKVTGELDRGLTRPGVIMGTPEYMAPEQAFSADAVDSRADIFSLGVIIFEMLAGRRPVGGDEATVIASQYIQGQVAQLRDLAPNVPAELAAAIHKAMAPMAKDRLATVAELRAAIEGVRGGAPAAAGVAHASTTPAGAAAAVAAPPRHEVSSVPSPVAASPAPSAVPRTNAGEEVSGHVGGDGAVAAAGYAHASSPPPAHGTSLDAPPAAAHMHVQNGGAAFPATAEYVPPPQRPGGTDIGAAEAFVPPYMGASHTAAANAQGMPGTAPMEPYAAQAYQQVVPVPQAARPARRGGGAFVFIVLLAASISGLVVGGLWIAHRFAQTEEAADDPVEPPSVPLQPTPSVPTVAEPPPSVPTTPPSIPTTPTVKPPPATPAKPPTSTKPPVTTPPTSTGVVIPGPFPTFFPTIPMPTLPGLGGGTTNPPSTGSGGSTPPSTGSGGSNPPAGSTTRPPIKIPVPRPK